MFFHEILIFGGSAHAAPAPAPYTLPSSILHPHAGSLFEKNNVWHQESYQLVILRCKLLGGFL